MDLGRRGIRSLAVARTNEEGKWTMMGILTFLDPPRPDTKDTIERAMEYGVDVKMITGAHGRQQRCRHRSEWCFSRACCCVRGMLLCARHTAFKCTDWGREGC